MKKYLTLFFVFVFTLGLYAQVRVLPDRVGIGLLNPDSTLHVLGGVQIDGKLRLGQGDENIFIDFETGGINTSGENNIGIGTFTANSLSTGSHNIIFGKAAGQSLSLGHMKINCGYGKKGLPWSDGTNKFLRRIIGHHSTVASGGGRNTPTYPKCT
ncbi:MAG: hypothetical protein AAGG68_29175, partial [Bacteroidota bacterium]